MQSELALDKPAFMAVLGETYGLDIVQLTFVPRGLAAYGYIAEARDGARTFIKVYDPARVEPTATVDPGFALPLTWNLYHDGDFRRLPCPIRARDGAFVTRFEQYDVVALTYLAGRMLDELPQWPQAVREELARVVGQLHASTGRIRLDGVRAEQFDVSYLSQLTAALDTLEALPPDAPPTHATLRALVLPYRDNLLGRIECFAELARAAQAQGQGQEMVLCHTDLWEGNLLQDERGDVYILDWDDIRLAPAEQDLFFYVRQPHDIGFLNAYEQSFGPVQLHAETFGYYEYRRNFDDITAFIIQLLGPEEGEQETRDALRWLTGNLEDGLNLEGRLATVRTLLDDRKRGR